jgi:hypothetical protein
MKKDYVLYINIWLPEEAGHHECKNSGSHENSW